MSPTNQQEDGKRINLTCQYSGTSLPDSSYEWFISGQNTSVSTSNVYQPVISYMAPTDFECQVINPNGTSTNRSDQYTVTGKVFIFQISKRFEIC